MYASTHEVGEVYVAILIQKHVVGLDISVDDALSVDVSKCAAELGDPESHGLLRERLPRYVESQITAAHKIHDEIPA
jgi:hypothetical protein